MVFSSTTKAGKIGYFNFEVKNGAEYFHLVNQTISKDYTMLSSSSENNFFWAKTSKYSVAPNESDMSKSYCFKNI